MNLPNLVFNRVFTIEDEEEVKLREYLNNTKSIDAKIIALLNSFDAKLYKSIKTIPS